MASIDHLKAYIIVLVKHYRILLISRTKKNNRFEGQTWGGGGGIKDMLSPHVKTWRNKLISPITPGFTQGRIGNEKVICHVMGLGAPYRKFQM